MNTKTNISYKIQFGISRAETALYRLLLRPLGLMNWLFSGKSVINSQAGTSMSRDGCYLISWSWGGLIYLIELGFAGPPVVTSFVVEPEPWGAFFSKDMQQIIVTHGSGERTILSAVPGAGFCRRKFPVVQEWVTGTHTPRNIVDFISHTSSAYCKYVCDPKEKADHKSANPFPPPPQTEDDCDWGQWIASGERYLDIPRDTCKADG